MPAKVPYPEDSPLSPRDEVILDDIAEHLRKADPAFVSRMSGSGSSPCDVPFSVRAAGGLIAMPALALIVTQPPSAEWHLVGLLIALHLLPIIVLLAVERGDAR